MNTSLLTCDWKIRLNTHHLLTSLGLGLGGLARRPPTTLNLLFNLFNPHPS